MNQNQANSGIPRQFNRRGKCSSVRSVSCSSGRASRGSRPTAGNLSTLRRAPTRQFLTLFPVPRSVGVPTPVWILMVCAAVCYLALHRMGFGRYVRAIGVKPGVAWHSGIRVPFTLAQVYVGAAFLAGVAGILLSANVRSYVRCPESPISWTRSARLSSERRGAAVGPRHDSRCGPPRAGEKRTPHYRLELLLVARGHRRPRFPRPSGELRPPAQEKLIGVQRRRPTT